MALEFDPAKDVLNLEKHGVSLRRAAELEIVARAADARFEELRYRAYGYIDGRPYCLAYVIRGDNVRAISLRRAREEEMVRHGARRRPA